MSIDTKIIFTPENSGGKVVDLTEAEDKFFDESLLVNGGNEFEYELPTSKAKITFKLLTTADEKRIEQELKGLKKINKNASPE